MNPYKSFVEPFLVDLTCGTKPVRRQREKVVPRAHGRVLEVGAGSGHNFPFYDPNSVEMVFALEPAKAMRKRAAQRKDAAPIDIRWLDLPGEEIPLDDDSVDTVLVTYTLCTIPDVGRALHQMRRVLKPAGDMVFCEHGAAPDAGVLKWQDRLNPIWKMLGGGCNINRAIPALIGEAGFEIDELDEMYLPNTPKIAGYNYWGVAHSR